MLAALIAGERDPKVLPQLARRSMRGKIAVLEQAFTGHFTDHHAFLLGTMLGRVDAISADIAALDDRIAAQAAPLASSVARLDEIPGISLASTYVILAEIGTDMALPDLHDYVAFPTYQQCDPIPLTCRTKRAILEHAGALGSPPPS